MLHVALTDSAPSQVPRTGRFNDNGSIARRKPLKGAANLKARASHACAATCLKTRNGSSRGQANSQGDDTSPRAYAHATDTDTGPETEPLELQLRDTQVSAQRVRNPRLQWGWQWGPPCDLAVGLTVGAHSGERWQWGWQWLNTKRDLPCIHQPRRAPPPRPSCAPSTASGHATRDGATQPRLTCVQTCEGEERGRGSGRVNTE